MAGNREHRVVSGTVVDGGDFVVTCSCGWQCAPMPITQGINTAWQAHVERETGH